MVSKSELLKAPIYVNNGIGYELHYGFYFILLAAMKINCKVPIESEQKNNGLI